MMFDINKSLKYIEIETCSNCTRACKWCLFGKYDNFRGKTNKYLETKYILSIFKDLNELDFNGTIAFHSINEPLLDERISSGHLIKLCKEHLKDANIRIITNGDLLETDILENLYCAGLDKLSVSCYDDHTYKKVSGFKEKYADINILDQRRYNLGRWESNRAGTIEMVMTSKIQYNSCFMPFFRTVIGWDGEIRLCCHEAMGVIKFGNIKKENLTTILNKEVFIKYREELVNNRKNLYPCNKCNVNGSLNYMLEHMNEKREVMDILRLINVK